MSEPVPSHYADGEIDPSRASIAAVMVILRLLKPSASEADLRFEATMLWEEQYWRLVQLEKQDRENSTMRHQKRQKENPTLSDLVELHGEILRPGSPVTERMEALKAKFIKDTVSARTSSQSLDRFKRWWLHETGLPDTSQDLLNYFKEFSRGKLWLYTDDHFLKILAARYEAWWSVEVSRIRRNSSLRRRRA